MRSSVRIRAAQETDAAALAGSLATAFADDPLLAWLNPRSRARDLQHYLARPGDGDDPRASDSPGPGPGPGPDDGTRDPQGTAAQPAASAPLASHLLADVFAAQITCRYLPAGHADVAEVGGEPVGGLLWRYSQDGRDWRPGTAEQRAWWRLAGVRAWRLVRSLYLIAVSGPQEPHIVLGALGLIPEARGHGIASGLLAPCLATADRGGFPIYTGTLSTTFLPLLERFGFRLHDRIDLPAGPAAWTLLRPPARPS